MNLPPPTITYALLDVYMESTHWYMTVLHEPTLRSQLQDVLDTGVIHRRKRPFLMLVLIVLTFGAHFIDTEKEQRCSGVDIPRLEAEMFRAAETWFLATIEEQSVDTVAFGFLMACYYLLTRKTRASFTMMGVTVQVAQAMRLHQEESWGPVADVEREIRRRVWWTVFIGARYELVQYSRQG